jgi:hypothetical protein
MDDQVVDGLAHALYIQGIKIDMWHMEQEHVKYSYYDAARKLLKKLDSLGFVIVKFEPTAEVIPDESAESEKPVPKPKKRKSAATKKLADTVPDCVVKGQVAKELEDSFKKGG